MKEVLHANLERYFSAIHAFMRFLVFLTAVMIPIGVGYWRYKTLSDSPYWGDFALGLTLSSVFSGGLLLSLTKLGRRFKWVTLAFIVISAFLHFGFVGYYGDAIFTLVVLTELYAVFSLFRGKAPS